MDGIERFSEREAKAALRAAIALANGLIAGIAKGNPAFAELVRDVVARAESGLARDTLAAPARDYMDGFFDGLRKSAFEKAGSNPGDRHRAIQGGPLDKLGHTDAGAPRRQRGK